MIYTSYFGNVRNIPQSVVPVSIARWSPRYWSGARYLKLAPSKSILDEYKHLSQDELKYRIEFNRYLDSLDQTEVFVDLSILAGDKPDVALLCYETPGKFCHRHLVKEWLIKNGIPCMELK